MTIYLSFLAVMAIVVVLLACTPGLRFGAWFGRIVGLALSNQSASNQIRGVLGILVALLFSIATVINFFEHPVLFPVTKQLAETQLEKVDGVATKVVKNHSLRDGVLSAFSNGQLKAEDVTFNKKPDPKSGEGEGEGEGDGKDKTIVYPSSWLWLISLLLWLFFVPYFILSWREEAMDAWKSVLKKWEESHKSTATAGADGTPPPPSGGASGGNIGGFNFRKLFKFEILGNFAGELMMKIAEKLFSVR
ncbi:MAG: hypothetical protein WCP18_01010 [bacterium]